MNIERYFAWRRQIVNDYLDRLLPGEDQYPSVIHKAMRYSLFAGGKRLRPILALAAGEAIGAGHQLLLPAACAIEMIHTYSLIHDDLPALDNDDLRRGRPTCHKVFGEAIAILAGDALLTTALEVLASLPTSSEGAEAGLSEHDLQRRKLEVIREIATAAGTVSGMIGGQVVDLQSEGRQVSSETLDYIHNAKTAALFVASVASGAIMAGADGEKLRLFRDYGRKIGLAFQIIDDILDIEETTERLGKTAGKDVEQHKATYPALWGLERSKQKVQELIESAVDDLKPLGAAAEPLVEIARYIGRRRA